MIRGLLLGEMREDQTLQAGPVVFARYGDTQQRKPSRAASLIEEKIAIPSCGEIMRPIIEFNRHQDSRQVAISDHEINMLSADPVATRLPDLGRAVHQVCQPNLGKHGATGRQGNPEDTEESQLGLCEQILTPMVRLIGRNKISDRRYRATEPDKRYDTLPESRRRNRQKDKSEQKSKKCNENEANKKFLHRYMPAREYNEGLLSGE